MAVDLGKKVQLGATWLRNGMMTIYTTASKPNESTIQAAVTTNLAVDLPLGYPSGSAS